MGAASPKKAAPRRAAKAPVNKGGRPRKLHVDEASLKQVRGLGQIQATEREGAAFFDVSLPTFKEFLAMPGVREAYDQGKGNGRISLRRTQFALAQKSAAMAIFLGKNYLEQTDKVANEISGPNGKPIEVRDLSALTDEQLDALERAAIALANGNSGAGGEPEPIPAEHRGGEGEAAPGAGAA